MFSIKVPSRFYTLKVIELDKQDCRTNDRVDILLNLMQICRLLNIYHE